MGRPKGSKNKPKVIDTANARIVIEKLDAVIKAEKPKRIRKRKEAEPADKAALKALMNAPISPAEVKKLREEAKANTPKEGHAEAVVNRAVLEVIKPIWDSSPVQADGCKHFHVKTFRHGESVSMDKEKWDAALKAHGIRGTVQSSKSVDGLDQDSQRVSLWRVMIG